MIIKEYNEQFKTVWNEFVLNSKQGTFLLNRNYMDYHADRFVDKSLMFYDQKDKLIAVLPANIRDNVLYSHQGLSYGGLIYGLNAKTVDILNCFAALQAYAKQNNIQKLIYKRVPAIYQSYPADEDLYALFRHDAKLIRRDIGHAINFENKMKWEQGKRTSLNQSVRNGIIVQDSNEYEAFYNVLAQVLARHNVKPVHSLEEIYLLMARFPQNIKLVCSYKGDEVVSGAWLFVNKGVIHTQYIATSDEGRQCGGVEALINYLPTEYASYKYLSFGISTEDGGRYLNEGLAFQKESFGGRGVCYDFYELSFT